MAADPAPGGRGDPAAIAAGRHAGSRPGRARRYFLMFLACCLMLPISAFVGSKVSPKSDLAGWVAGTFAVSVCGAVIFLVAFVRILSQRHRRVRQVVWALVPIVSVTVLAWWPFLVLALVRRRARDWAVFTAYLAAVAAEIVALFVLAAQGASASAAITFYALVLLVAVTAAVHTLVAFRPRAKVPSWPSPERASDGAPGTVTICKGQGLFMRADDAGLLVRNFYGRAHRIGWTEISHFADGSYTKEGVTGWQLFIVLRTGKWIPVTSSVLAPPGEVVAAVRQAAQPHGIPADLSGVAAKRDGRPASRGLYWEPGGQPGLRYWDGRQWSPLLPPDVAESRSQTAQKAPDSWSELPTADGGWTYAAAAARRSTVLSAVGAAIAAALLAWAWLIQLGWHHLGWHGDFGVGGWFSVGLFAAGFALGARSHWRNRKFFLKLDAAANRAPSGWS